jgi:all-trans-retinol 13,14-reductase
VVHISGPQTSKLLENQKWDAIVIGSGLGGMTTAALLAKAGKKVLILERHYVPGGFTHTFKRKGFEWDVGVHYVGQVQDSKSILRKIFNYVGDNKIKWAPMGSVYDRAIIEGDHYEFVVGREEQIQKLVEYFPKEEKAIRQYMKLVSSVAASSAWFFGEKTMPPFLSNTIGRLLRFRFEKYSKFTTLEVLNKLTTNKKLISVLTIQCGNYGLAPNESSFGIHSVVVDHYINGGCYPSGGARSIQKAILEGFHTLGGTLVLQAEVRNFVMEKDKVVGVELVDGQKFFAPKVISNTGVRNTFKKLLPPEFSIPENIKSALYDVKPSAAHVCLYIGLSASDSELNLPKNNIWIYDDYDFSKLDQASNGDPLSNRGLTYICFPSSKDPQWKDKSKATIQVIAPCSYERVRDWQEKPQGDRGNDYLEYKNAITKKLTQKLLTVVPQVKGKIAFSELSTPLSTKHFSNYSTGEIYGLEHTPKRFTYKFLRPQTFIKGLYLTGQDIVTVGVGGALYSGVLAATKVLNKSVMLRILLNRPLS